MGNMGYCMFENTYKDLQACYEKLDYETDIDHLSESEREYAIKLLKMCKDMADDYWVEIQDE